MADKLELLQEADRRGILPPDKKEMFDEALRRGLIKTTPQSSMQAIQEKMEPTTLRQNFMRDFGRPTLEIGGLMGGAAVGTLAAAPSGPVGEAVLPVAGAGLGYSIGKQISDLIEENLGSKKAVSLKKRTVTAGKDIIRGGEMEMGGRILARGAGLAFEGGKQVLGRLTGTGKAAIEEGLKGTPAFKQALRGKITGQEVVENTREALNLLKTGRANIYQKELAQISKMQQPIDIQPIRDKLQNLLGKYTRIDAATGQPDWSRSAIGPEKSEGVKKIKEIVETIQNWGSKQGDNTAVGLDMLKRQMDDFYSESSNARSFVTGIRNIVKDTIVEAVPQYEKMTAGYAEATKLIKDIESGLMLRKQGISGRIIADQTLRRLTSAMKDNFELRRDLVNLLGYASGENIAGQVAGHAMSSIVPRGLSGTGPSLIGQAALVYFVNPKFWPVLAASSPRVSGEFLVQFGKALRFMPGMSEPASKIISYWIGRQEPEKKVIRGGQ